jgi:hypothetical protein
VEAQRYEWHDMQDASPAMMVSTYIGTIPPGVVWTQLFDSLLFFQFDGHRQD